MPTAETVHPMNHASYESFEAACIEAAKKEVRRLWDHYAPQRRLAGLHAELGYDSPDALITALENLEKTGKPKRKKRVSVTPELASRAAEMKSAGKPPKEVAATLGVSYATAIRLLNRPL